jgi:hypothetical protein
MRGQDRPDLALEELGFRIRCSSRCEQEAENERHEAGDRQRTSIHRTKEPTARPRDCRWDACRRLAGVLRFFPCRSGAVAGARAYGLATAAAHGLATALVIFGARFTRLVEVVGTHIGRRGLLATGQEGIRERLARGHTSGRGHAAPRANWCLTHSLPSASSVKRPELSSRRSSRKKSPMTKPGGAAAIRRTAHPAAPRRRCVRRRR